MIARSLAALLTLAVVTVMGGNAYGSAEAVTDPTSQCQMLANEDFSRIPDAPTQVSESKVVEPSGNESSYCQVSGYVAPQVGFILRLPITGWNEKLLQLGCGGNCGSTTDIHASSGDFSGCIDSVRRHYACVLSDNGHTGKGTLWAYNNLQAEIDSAYRGAHVVALAAKVLVERYYRQGPKKSYFWGCSTGGRQALMEAQRFPWDFDGIIAGDPTLGEPDAAMAFLWAARVLTDTNGKFLFEQVDLELLHRAALAKCDLNDGVKDGVIEDPRSCDFDPSKLLCTAGKQPGCLTPEQVGAAQKMYSGPPKSQGSSLFHTPIALKGSELSWQLYFTYGRSFANEEFRYSKFWPNPGPTWDSSDFDFDRDYKRVGLAKALYAPVNPDLREFMAAGGKLLAYTGWNTFVPLQFVDYYETVEKTMGGAASTQKFFRFFAVPGMEHCLGGEGAAAVDWLSYLEDWVEKGQAPYRVVGFHVPVDSSGDPFAGASPVFPLDPATVDFSRTFFPYPTQAKYLGRGNPKDAASFGPIGP